MIFGIDALNIKLHLQDETIRELILRTEWLENKIENAFKIIERQEKEIKAVLSIMEI